MQRVSFKLLILSLCVALLPTARASVEANPELTDFVKLLAQHKAAPQASSRKLLGGTACISKFTWTAGAYVGSCGGLAVKDESHWCDTDDLTTAVLTNAGYTSSDIQLFQAALTYAGSPDSFCVGESDADCCKPNGGAIAGVIIGCVAGLAAIVTLFAFCCRCCCFRPKQVVVMQQQPAAAPQVVVVPATK